MTDILPIDIENLVDEEENNESQVNSLTNEEEEEEGVTMEIQEGKEEKDEAECFEKPKPIDFNDKQLNAKGKPRKRKMSEKQLANLKKAQEKSLVRRRELKAARDLEKAEKQAKKSIEVEKKLERKLENEVKLKMAARMREEAQEHARKNEVWDEARLSNLMEKTIDNYMTKRKAQKPKPREVIPPPQQPAQYDPRQYAPAPRQPPQSYRPSYNHTQQDLTDPYATLFGNYQ